MLIDISELKTMPDSELTIDESEVIPDLNDVTDTISITRPVAFKGVLSNITELLSLRGEATCTYEVQCDYCTKTITRSLMVPIDEVLVETSDAQKDMTESDEYTYQGNWIELDKILTDNIILSIPMRHRCKQDCAIVCQICEEPITGMGCGCDDKRFVDPRLEVLKELVDKKY